MELSSEDVLRLNVLLANEPQAIRIDESAMVVYGLSEQGEAVVRLNPVGPEDTYLRRVRELLSGQVLGSPGGYPVYLKRWTRMGQMRDESLAQLLLLGEPEAVVAVVCAPGLTDELARRAWWALEDPENARHMLGNEHVVRGAMGRELARYLVDYLPFETEAEKMMETVRLVLQPGLVDAREQAELWRKSARKQAYLVGFLAAIPDELPEQAPPRSDAPHVEARLGSLIQAGNDPAEMLLKVLSAEGQTFLRTVRTVLTKPPTQDVVTATLDILGYYFRPMRPSGDPDRTLPELTEEAAAFCDATRGHPDIAVCIELGGEWLPELRAMRVLSGLGYGVVRPVFRNTTATGSLMRRKLAPVVDPLLAQIATLLAPGS